ncbi:hypothetical protein [Methanosarcina sp.]|uniref:hypothetical protein n=1 Tax=Methanosarcina sp. TaxID=2213 RepID=UPI002ABB91A3|nr:hypothetical protein [Methanosarcina sp.]MDY9927133.1 hypothetical protein [Methanosarcina sp.]
MPCGKINNQRETIDVRELGYILCLKRIILKIQGIKQMGSKGANKFEQKIPDFIDCRGFIAYHWHTS